MAFLETCPRVRFVEGAFGPLLLRADVTSRPLRFGRGGRPRRPTGPGLGVSVFETALHRVTATPIPAINL
jgi:hypothetical protein